MFQVTTPVAGFTGVSAGVNFTNGVAVIDGNTNAAALRYFRGAGYLVEETDGTDKAAAEPETDGGDPADEMPKKSASTEVWRAYAVRRGMTEDQAAQMSRDVLVGMYTGEENQS